jgi:hypothetical protein
MEGDTNAVGNVVGSDGSYLLSKGGINQDYEEQQPGFSIAGNRTHVVFTRRELVRVRQTECIRNVWLVVYEWGRLRLCKSALASMPEVPEDGRGQQSDAYDAAYDSTGDGSGI